MLTEFMVVIFGLSVVMGIVFGLKRRADFSIIRCVVVVLFWMVSVPVFMILSIGDLVKGVMAGVEAAIDGLSLGINSMSADGPVGGHAIKKKENLKTRDSLQKNTQQCSYFFGRIAARAAGFIGFRRSMRNFDTRFRPPDMSPPDWHKYKDSQAAGLGAFISPHTPGGTRYPFEEDYRIVERMPSGGSTAKLFKVQKLVNGKGQGDLLVLKYFDLQRGSNLENIVRESGSVQQAMRLGIVTDARTSRDFYYYVLPFYHGENLSLAVARLHRDISTGEALPNHALEQILIWAQEVVSEISRYHKNGLFHKDIKPDNIIVSLNKAFLIDVGLVTPMDSGLLLTTHGTEYFRDPEMVRMAIQETLIKDTDCAKFDIYSLGATLYYMLEGTFPASGSLSRYTRKVPYVLQCITNKAMTDMEKRYDNIEDMLHDIQDALYMAKAEGWDNVKVSDLYSFGGDSGMVYMAPGDEFNASYTPGRHMPREDEPLDDYIPTGTPAAGDYRFQVDAQPVEAVVEGPVNVVRKPARFTSLIWGLLAAVILLAAALPFSKLVNVQGHSKYAQAGQDTSTIPPIPSIQQVKQNSLNIREVPAKVASEFTSFKHAVLKKLVSMSRVYDVDKVPVLLIDADRHTVKQEDNSEFVLLREVYDRFARDSIPLAELLSPAQERQLQDSMVKHISDDPESTLLQWVEQQNKTGTAPYILYLNLEKIDSPNATRLLLVKLHMHYEREDYLSSFEFQIPAVTFKK
ncbi:hypothetical protein ACFL54_00725 [Planctomycetota bacterium]